MISICQKCLLVCLSSFTYALTSFPSENDRQPYFERVLTDEGISKGTIYSIIQDRQGYLWLGTATGLLRYDGYVFRSYRHDPTDTNSIAGDFIWSVSEDSSGNLWIGTSGKGLDCYIPTHDRFVHYKNVPDDTTSLFGDEVPCVFVDSNNDVWAGSWNKGLNKFDRRTNTFVRYSLEHGLPSKNVHRIVEDKQGRVWIGTKRGLVQFDRNLGTGHAYRHDPNKKNTLPDDYIYSIYQTRDGEVWIGTSRALCKYDSATDDFEQVSIPELQNPIQAMHEDVHGNLWIASDGDGIIKLSPATGRYEIYLPNPQDPLAISSRVGLSLYRDRTGIMWIGTAATGLSKFNPGRKKFRHVLTNPETVNALFEDKDGMLWIGTQGGINTLGPSDSHPRKFQLPKGLPKAIDEGVIYALSGDSLDNIWIGTLGSALYRFNKRTGELRHFGFGLPPDKIGSDEVTSLILDSKGNTWIGLNGGGMSRHDPAKGIFFSNYNLTTDSSIASDYVWAIHEDRKGFIWFGMWDVGVARLDPMINDTLVFRTSSRSSNGKALSGHPVVSIAEDAEGVMWFGTWGFGLNRYDPDLDTFTHYSTVDGLPNNYIYGILTDDTAGELWLTTGNGLARFNPVTGKCITYDEADGIQSSEFRRGAVHKGRSGRFYVGGVNGFNSFRPEEIAENTHPPPLALTSVRVLDRNINPLASSIQLSYADNYISFEYASLDFSDPGKNRCSYRLVGLEEDWIQAGRRRSVSYANLDPGEYVFHVRGSNNDGVWNEEGISFLFLITPPPWKTWWAYSSYVLLLILTSIAWRGYEINKIRRNEREQAALREAELRAELDKQQTRIQIARDLHDDVGSTLSSISFFAQAISTKASDGDKFLSLISESSSLAKEAMSDIIWSIDPVNDNWENIIAKFQRYASDLLDSKGINHHIEMPPPDHLVLIDPQRRRNFWLVFKEVITNAAKHSQCSEIRIRFNYEGSLICLMVEDNGKGFDHEAPSQGNGLNNIRARLQSLDATVDLKTSQGKGTRWDIRFKA